jgi:hypothetical protein
MMDSARSLLSIGGAYFAFKDHVLFSKRHFGEEAPALIAIYSAVFMRSSRSRCFGTPGDYTG